MAAQQSGNGSGNAAGNLDAGIDENTALSSLKELIAAGDHRLDPMLATITDAARQMTGATGAALAMWKEGAMVCRARSGDTAPALGARLSAETGISGECLRTGRVQHCADTENDPLVDVEVCRTLGLRSIAVLPIQGWRGINGILEVFSTKPSAFSEQHIALLDQLAALAERARASQPHGASSSTPRLPSAIERPQSAGLLPASDRVGDVALAFLGTQSRPFVLGFVGLVAMSLLALVIWLGWRGADDGDGKAHAATPASGDTANVNAVTARSPDQHVPRLPLDGDPVWKPNPGGESLFSSSGKPSAGSPVKFASKIDAVAGNKIQTARSPLLADVAAKVAAEGVVPRDGTVSQTEMPAIGSSTTPRSTTPRYDEPTSSEVPSIAAGSTNQSSLSGVLSAKASLPAFSAPVSRGVSGGQLIESVSPVYPSQARRSHVEGTVVLTAVIMEDGTVRDVKVVEGPATLAQSAVDAVKQRRYQPFELDGKPVKNEIRIRVDFKLSTEGH